MTPEEAKGLAIESGLCCVNGFGETVRTAYATVDHILTFAAAIEAATIEKCCAAIKSADDKSNDEDYMLDSDDCIEVIRAIAKKEGT